MASCAMHVASLISSASREARGQRIGAPSSPQAGYGGLGWGACVACGVIWGSGGDPERCSARALAAWTHARTHARTRYRSSPTRALVRAACYHLSMRVAGGEGGGGRWLRVRGGLGRGPRGERFADGSGRQPATRRGVPHARTGGTARAVRRESEVLECVWVMYGVHFPSIHFTWGFARAWQAPSALLNSAAGGSMPARGREPERDPPPPPPPPRKALVSLEATRMPLPCGGAGGGACRGEFGGGRVWQGSKVADVACAGAG